MSSSLRQKLRHSYQAYCANSPFPDYAKYIDSIKQTVNLPGMDKVVYMVCDNLNYQILYTSDCLNLFGFTADNPSDVGRFMAQLDPDHSDYIQLSNTWHLDLHEKLSTEQRVNSLGVHCGIKFRRLTDGKVGRLLAVSHFIEPDDNNFPRIVLVIMQDVAHLYKSDHYWLWASFGSQHQQVFHYLSDSKRVYEKNILSVREKEVLFWLNEGLDSKEIGARLLISAETAQQHRRNMLARTGARDTTALLQLVRWCSFV